MPYQYLDFRCDPGFSGSATKPSDARESPVSASKSLHALLSQLNKEVAAERLAEAQGVTLEPGTVGIVLGARITRIT